MAFSSNSSGGVMADINVTPLVDVMLVLLIIFMITAPLAAQKVKVELPTATLDKKPLLEQNLAITVARDPQPQVDIRADNDTKYSLIQKTVKTIRASGMRKVGFVSMREK